jgi:serine phosphatase RsbU (regulator of sigma subunit)/anti-sigma regulatory factor (Ser/Thr protein kinase)
MGPAANQESQSFELSEHQAVRDARVQLAKWLTEVDRIDLLDEAQLVLSELVTNALLHGGGWAHVTLTPTPAGIRIDVRDREFVGPVLGWASESSMTGRGLALVRALAHDCGVEPAVDGKVVWAEVTPIDDDALVRAARSAFERIDSPDALRTGDVRYRVTLGEVPTALLLDAKSHVDNLVREFTLAAAGARTGSTAPVPSHLATLIEAVVNRFAEARQSIKIQALDAAHAGQSHTRLVLHLPESAADAAEEYLSALDEADAYCRAMRLLTLETPPQHRVFREWYIGQLVAQLRAASIDGPVPPPQPFEERLLTEIDRVAEARRASERAARLVAVTSALAGAATPEDVAHAVLTEGVAALGAFGGGLLVPTGAERLAVPGTVGYSPDLVERLRNEDSDADLPAAVALRTGEAVWIESIQERDVRFPQLAGLERDTVAMCAVPLAVRGRRLGALRFSFGEPRLFGEDERRFVFALAAQCAQALDRAQLQHDRDEISRRLQRSLLPPRLPAIAGLDAAAVYHPLGRGVEVGGDFYDMWEIAENCWAIVVGDVSGTGPEAAAISAQVRHTLHGLLMGQRDLDAVLHKLNAAMRRGTPSDDNTSMFCTAVLGRIDVSEGVSVLLGSGGHPSPLLRQADGTVSEVYLDGSLLGVLDEIDVTVTEVILRPGDTLVLFTDGLLEARDDGDFFGTERAVRVLQHSDGGAAAIVGALERAVLDHTHGQLNDDVAIVALRATI